MPEPPHVHLPPAYVAHRLPGRVRLEVPSRRTGHESLNRVREALLEVDIVGSVQVVPSTASLVVHFREPLSRLAERATR